MPPIKSINKISKIISETVSFGFNLTIYQNEISVKDIEENIIKTCFSGELFTTFQQNKFLSINYPKFYQRKSSSGLLAKSSIIHLTKNNNILTVSFPINLLKREIISFDIDEKNDRLELIAYESINELLEKLKAVLLHSAILTLKRYKIKLQEDTSIEHIKNQFKVVEIISH